MEQELHGSAVLIINRYLSQEITRPLLLIITILVVIYASFMSASYLVDATQGLLPGITVIYLTLLKTLVGLEVLLPTALYLAIVVGIGRMYTDSEMTALTASGVSEFQILKAVTRLALITAIIVAILTLYARPWAYRLAYKLEGTALAELKIEKLEAGRFYKLGKTSNVLFAKYIDHERERLQQVFFHNERASNSSVIRSREAYLSSAEDGSTPVMIFLNGQSYTLNDKGQEDFIQEFNTLTLYMDGFSDSGIQYKRKAFPLSDLKASQHPGDIAEYQWRLSMPLLTIMLGLLAVPMSRSKPRQGRFARLFLAILLFALYYNLASLARSWVDQGTLPPIPGLWWVHLLPAMIVLGLLWQPLLSHRWIQRTTSATKKTQDDTS